MSSFNVNKKRDSNELNILSYTDPIRAKKDKKDLEMKKLGQILFALIVIVFVLTTLLVFISNVSK